MFFVMEYIKRYIFGFIVCYKHGIKFRGFSFVGKLSYLYCNNGVKSNFKLYANIFHNNFYANLAHELGHFVDFRIKHHGIYPNRYVENICFTRRVFTNLPENFQHRGTEFNIILTQEINASRNARRLLKIWGKYAENHMQYLEWAIGTYCKNLYCIDRSLLADTTSCCVSKIRN